MLSFRPLVVFMCLVSVLAYGQESSKRAPKIVAESATFDFGSIENDGPIPFTFVLKNEGTGKLKIESVRPSCGCTVAELQDTSVKVGESTVVEGTVDLPGRQGPITKTMSVMSNDPDTPMLQLTIKGTLLRKIYFVPSGLSFAKISTKDERTERIVIKTDDENTRFNVTEFSLIDSLTNEPAEFFEVSKEVVKEGKEYSLAVRTIPPLPSRSIRANLIVKTDLPGYEELKAYVGAAPTGPVVVSPQVMILPQPKSDTRPSTRRVLVRPGTVTEFDILKVEFPEAEGVEVQWIYKENIGFMIDFLNLLPNDAMDEKDIVITTDIEGFEEIRVPIRIIRPQQVPRRPVAE